MKEKAVGHRRELAPRLGVLRGDRLLGAVSAGHHQDGRPVVEEQLLQRARRQEHAQLAQSRCDVRRQPASRAQGRQDDGARRGGERLAAHVVQHDHPLDLLQAPGHDGERLRRALLSCPQPRDGRRILRVDGQHEPTDPLDGQDRPSRQHPAGRANRRVAGLVRAVRRDQRDGRTTQRTGVGLGVKAPVPRVVVLGAAGSTEREGVHRRARPVVGERPHDRESRTTRGAIDEGIPKAAIVGIAQLAQAVGARPQIGGDRGERRRACRSAGDDAKRLVAKGGQRRGLDRVDAGRRRRRRGQLGDESNHRSRTALDLDRDPLVVVADEAAQGEVGGQATDGRPKAHALHGSPHAHGATNA